MSARSASCLATVPLRLPGLLLALLALACQLAILRLPPAAAATFGWCGDGSASALRLPGPGLPAADAGGPAIPFEAGTPPIPPDAVRPPGPVLRHCSAVTEAFPGHGTVRPVRLRPPPRGPPAPA